MDELPDQQHQAILKAENISKRFGRVQALSGINLSLYKQDILALLGDNGAGKSTLIKIISGNYRPDSGKVFLEGNEVLFGDPAEARAAGVETVYQQSSVCLHANVAANFFIGRERYVGIPGLQVLRKRTMQKETEEFMRQMKVHIPSVRTCIEYLSGGQRQAVILGRFFHWGGKVALLDEPFAALGVGESRKAIDLVRQTSDKFGLPIIMITHNVEYAMEVATRFVVLRHGRVVGEGAMADVTAEGIVGMITGAIRTRNGQNGPEEVRENKQQAKK